MTVEAVKDGLVPLTAGGYSQIPSLLQQELLRYAERAGIPSGPLFITRKGTPMNHSHITCSIQRICRDAQVAEKKGPRYAYAGCTRVPMPVFAPIWMHW